LGNKGFEISVAVAATEMVVVGVVRGAVEAIAMIWVAGQNA